MDNESRLIDIEMAVTNLQRMVDDLNDVGNASSALLRNRIW